MGAADHARVGTVERSAGSDSAKSTAELMQRCPGRCPQGHGLVSYLARQGHCDGCGRMVMGGERVMDCRQCNWYLCATCLPQPREEGSALWSTLSYIVDSAAQELTELAADFAALVPLASCTAPAQASPAPEEVVVVQHAGLGRSAAARRAAPASAGEQLETVDAWVKPEAPASTEAAANGDSAPSSAAVPASAAPLPDLLEFTEDLLDLTDSAPPPAAAPAPPPASSSVLAPAPPLDAASSTPAPTPSQAADEVAPAPAAPPLLAKPPAPLAPLVSLEPSPVEAHGAALAA